MNILTIIFLRLYGFNLGRSFRNLPSQACDDALMQMSMVIAGPLGLVFAILALPLPGATAYLKHPGISVLIAALAVALPVIYWVRRRFDHYRENPEAAERFRSSRERTKSFVALIMFPIVTLGIFGYAVHLVRSWPL